MKIPTTEEEYLKMLKMAFLEGQRSMEGELGYEEWGDMDPFPVLKAKYNFETWANQKWKYGKIQLHLANGGTIELKDNDE